MNWPATIAAFVIGALLCWFLKPCPECGTSTVEITVPDMRKADSLQTVVDTLEARHRQDSLALDQARYRPKYSVGMWKDSSLEATIEFIRGLR